RQTLLTVSRRGRSGIGAGQYSTPATAQLDGFRARQEEAVEHVVEFRPDFKPDVTLAVHEKSTAKAHRFRRLSLPAVVVQIRRCRSELSWRRIDPRVLIQDKIFGRVDAVAVRVFQEQRLAGNSIE